MNLTRYSEGHLHNGGEKVITYLNGKEICTSIAEYDGSNGIFGMSACDKPIKVKKGDVVSLKSVYDIVKHPMSVLLLTLSWPYH